MPCILPAVAVELIRMNILQFTFILPSWAIMHHWHWKGWMICPVSCFWIKLTAMRWKCSAHVLICCRKDLSDRGEVFDPVLSYWGLFIQATEGKEGSQALIFSGVSCSPIYSHWDFSITHQWTEQRCCRAGRGLQQSRARGKERPGTSRYHIRSQGAVREQRILQDAAGCSPSGSRSELLRGTAAGEAQGGPGAGRAGGRRGWAGPGQGCAPRREPAVRGPGGRAAVYF